MSTFRDIIECDIGFGKGLKSETNPKGLQAILSSRNVQRPNPIFSGILWILLGISSERFMASALPSNNIIFNSKSNTNIVPPIQTMSNTFPSNNQFINQCNTHCILKFSRPGSASDAIRPHGFPKSFQNCEETCESLGISLLEEEDKGSRRGLLPNGSLKLRIFEKDAGGEDYGSSSTTICFHSNLCLSGCQVACGFFYGLIFKSQISKFGTLPSTPSSTNLEVNSRVSSSEKISFVNTTLIPAKPNNGDIVREIGKDPLEINSDPWNLHLTSLMSHQEFLVIAELTWNQQGKKKDYLVTWELDGGGLKGHLITDSVQVTLSLWPDALYHIQVELFGESENGILGKSCFLTLNTSLSCMEEMLGSTTEEQQRMLVVDEPKAGALHQNTKHKSIKTILSVAISAFGLVGICFLGGILYIHFRYYWTREERWKYPCFFNKCLKKSLIRGIEEDEELFEEEDKGLFVSGHGDKPTKKNKSCMTNCFPKNGLQIVVISSPELLLRPPCPLYGSDYYSWTDDNYLPLSPGDDLLRTPPQQQDQASLMSRLLVKAFPQ